LAWLGVGHKVATGAHRNENQSSLKSEVFLTSLESQEGVCWVEYVV